MKMKLKHILLVVCVVLLVCASAGCVTVDKDGLLNTYHYSDAPGCHYISIYVDEYTGVEYLVYSGDGGYAGYGGICPRYNPDGTLKINEEFMK